MGWSKGGKVAQSLVSRYEPQRILPGMESETNFPEVNTSPAGTEPKCAGHPCVAKGRCHGLPCLFMGVVLASSKRLVV